MTSVSQCGTCSSLPVLICPLQLQASFLVFPFHMCSTVDTNYCGEEPAVCPLVATHRPTKPGSCFRAGVYKAFLRIQRKSELGLRDAPTELEHNALWLSGFLWISSLTLSQPRLFSVKSNLFNYTTNKWTKYCSRQMWQITWWNWWIWLFRDICKCSYQTGMTGGVLNVGWSGKTLKNITVTYSRSWTEENCLIWYGI